MEPVLGGFPTETRLWQTDFTEWSGVPVGCQPPVSRPPACPERLCQPTGAGPALRTSGPACRGKCEPRTDRVGWGVDTPIWRPRLSRPELRDASMSGVLALSIPAMAPDTEAAQCAWNALLFGAKRLLHAHQVRALRSGVSSQRTREPVGAGAERGTERLSNLPSRTAGRGRRGTSYDV